MNQRLLSSFAFLLVLCFAAVAQEAAKPAPNPASTATQQFARRASSLSGLVSDDSRFFVADPDAAVWTVTNPEALQSYAGRRAQLQAQESPATYELRVLCAKPVEAAAKPVAKLGDGAFRR